MTGGRTDLAWMVTFSDLVVLMLAFFVLMFAMSAFKAEAFERLTASLTETFRGAPALRGPDTPVTTTREEQGGHDALRGTRRPRAQDLGYLASVLTDTFAQDPRFAGTLVQGLDDRLVILLPADLLFSGGSADIAAGARPVVADLGATLSNLRNRIAVAGHTDRRPVSPDGPFPGNWELSLARAAAVANGLRRAGYSRPLEVWGHAATRFGALAQVPDAERARLARRVDIIVLPDRVEGPPA
ncbi:OmpA/MotB family protein [Roseospira visakhapatnamensis]|uniref:Chemotaxis protein MotB n=1 Tax=Roseospira visakhapatnamensis TaxID=390880 RepID=A0A7W6RET7_9PROT|nr:flagellar motor protein MotB [Roseospira visakhapatnamensis]MBB4266729.1 chemotaxis protein MotB [Roseospira visakhapatnamensis]